MTSTPKAGFADVRFRKDVALRVSYEDNTPFGSPTSQRIDENVRTMFSLVFEYAHAHGFHDLIEQSPHLLQKCIDSESFRRICESVTATSWFLRRDVLYPDTGLAQPRTLTISQENSGGVKLTLQQQDWPEVHALMAHLAGGNPKATVAKTSPGREFVRSLRDEGLAEPVRPELDAEMVDTDITFVGHNAVLIRTSSTCLLIDPFFFPQSETYPAEYQPLNRRDLGPVDAILVTHSHPDHFDPASLLQFDCETLVITPEIGEGGENLLSIDMTARLTELGFTNLQTLPWNSSLRVGDMIVHALPFYGEQPSDGDVLHPEVRNSGNTYVVVTPRFSVALVADSGHDLAGDAKRVASEWRRNFGPIDVLFSGYRGWATYPVQFLFSSVSRYLLFVPPHLWSARLQLMNDTADAVDLAELWGARYLVPYGDGGAPWHWGIGLGPRLDGTGVEDPAFDPFPERVVLETTSRARFPNKIVAKSAVQALVIHAGESLRGLPDSTVTVSHAGHRWPYTDRSRTC
jgi:L-ascorbate metabolism protein UlaG (beta-lactamase superfamily)